MEFQIYTDTSLSNYFTSNSKYPFYNNNNNNNNSLDIMDNDEYFNWHHQTDAKISEPTLTMLQQQQTPNQQQQQQQMLLLSSSNRKRKLNNATTTTNEDNDEDTNASSVIVDDSSDNSADSSLTHDSVIKAPPAKAIMLKANNADMILGHSRKKDLAGNGGSKMPQWQVEDIAELNADIEGSLNEHPTFNMNDAILSISGLTVFKQEAPSPSSTSGHIGGHDGNGGARQLGPIQLVQCANGNQYGRPNNNNTDGNNNNNGGGGDMYGNSGQQMNGYGGGQQQGRSPSGAIDVGNPNNNNTSSQNQNQVSHVQIAVQDSYASISSSTNSTPDENSGGRGDRQFQYVLGAATSIATKMNEDTLTYLNQGQSYEIKLKALSGGVVNQYRSKTLQSVIRVCFHERRLQYMEREQMLSWQRARPGDRILEMDVPLSYGVADVTQPANQLNWIQFNWDPSKDTGAYIKVNCISTEFTPKKHGGEKGVPFRIQVATYDNTGAAAGHPVLLHAAACQVKVFKLKGADRKHKQDRDKVLKRPVIEQDKFQPSYDCTVLNEISSDAVVSCAPNDQIDSFSCERYSRNGGQSVVNTPIVPKVNASLPDAKPQLALTTSNAINSNINHGVEKLHSEQSNNNGNNNNIIREDIILSEQQQSQRVQQQLTSTADPSQAIRWLVANRFERFLASFGNFSGADLLRMSRDDLIQVCGQPDGIRLFNALHSKTIAPALTIYISRNRSSPYHAIYLRSFSTNELQAKLSSVLSLASADCISAIYVQGPQGIHVHLEDTVLRHIRDETMFNVVVLGNNGGSSDGFAVLLKPESNAKGGSSSSSFDDRSN